MAYLPLEIFDCICCLFRELRHRFMSTAATEKPESLYMCCNKK